MSHTISRRGFMAAAGGVTLFPATAAISTEPADDDRLRACVIEIRDILKRQHPVVDEVHDNLLSSEDGTFRLSIQGARRFEAYSGEGVYEISLDGISAAYWLQQDMQRRVSDGSVIPGSEFCWGRRIDDGEFVGDVVRMGARPRIIRKLEAWEEGTPLE